MFDRFLAWLLKDNSSLLVPAVVWGRGMHTGAVPSIAVNKDGLKQAPDASQSVPAVLLPMRIVTLGPDPAREVKGKENISFGSNSRIKPQGICFDKQEK